MPRVPTGKCGRHRTLKSPRSPWSTDRDVAPAPNPPARTARRAWPGRVQQGRGAEVRPGRAGADPGGRHRHLRDVAADRRGGVRGREVALKHPILVTKVDNTSSAAPQIGLKQADLVVEELVEGGTTHLAVFYYSQLPDTVGPVRSMRASDLSIVPEGADIVTSGAAPVTIKRIKDAGYTFHGEARPASSATTAARRRTTSSPGSTTPPSRPRPTRPCGRTTTCRGVRRATRSRAARPPGSTRTSATTPPRGAMTARATSTTTRSPRRASSSPPTRCW